MVRDGRRLLEELGAVSGRGRLTAVGRKMARLPIDPKLSRMVLAAAESGCLAEILIIVSGLAVQDPGSVPGKREPRQTRPTQDFPTLALISVLAEPVAVLRRPATSAVPEPVSPNVQA